MQKLTTKTLNYWFDYFSQKGKSTMAIPSTALAAAQGQLPPIFDIFSNDLECHIACHHDENGTYIETFFIIDGVDTNLMNLFWDYEGNCYLKTKTNKLYGVKLTQTWTTTYQTKAITQALLQYGITPNIS
jgi:hypothetical protein